MKRPDTLLAYQHVNDKVANDIDATEGFWSEDIDVLETLANLTYDVLVGNVDSAKLNEILKGI